ncbi:hypothetical protein OF83DRAFT_1134612 [Amylostereum chailletii]|nr:hypothetical protein OF83DRAFT_1134612 [Amylostereum chailletii]
MDATISTKVNTPLILGDPEFADRYASMLHPPAASSSSSESGSQHYRVGWDLNHFDWSGKYDTVHHFISSQYIDGFQTSPASPKEMPGVYLWVSMDKDTERNHPERIAVRTVFSLGETSPICDFQNAPEQPRLVFRIDHSGDPPFDIVDTFSQLPVRALFISHPNFADASMWRGFASQSAVQSILARGAATLGLAALLAEKPGKPGEYFTETRYLCLQEVPDFEAEKQRDARVFGNLLEAAEAWGSISNLSRISCGQKTVRDAICAARTKHSTGRVYKVRHGSPIERLIFVRSTAARSTQRDGYRGRGYLQTSVDVSCPDHVIA